jgi:thiol-disulfide isomerase/thioredoxin
MSKRMKLYGLMLAVVLGVAACAPAAAPAATPEAMKEATPETMMEATPDAMMAETPDAMMSHDAMTDTMMSETPDAMASHAMTDTMMEATPDAMMEATPDAMTDTMMEATPDAMMPHDAMTDTMMEATPEAMMPHAAMTDTMMAAPAWFGANLTEATTGATFTVQDFKDKVVLVETMAMWCPTCLQQQQEVKALHDQLGMRDDLVTLGIDVDINENLAGLKDYVAKNGFDWTYTVASTDVARDISNLYGAQFLNPPSTPMLIIDKHGEAHPLPFGLKSAADLQKALEPYLNDAM